MSELDTSKPYGNVVGSRIGARYEQAGRLFNAHKQEIDAEGKVKGGKAKAADADTLHGSEPETDEAPATEAPAEPKPAAKPRSRSKKKPAPVSAPAGVEPLGQASGDDQ